MSKEIIYSLKEYQEKYNSSLEKYFLEYKEIEEIDFINDEIEKYNICLQIINFPIRVAFSWFFRIEYGINLKTFSIPQETFDFIYANENADYYYKIYNDIIEPVKQNHSLKEDCERKIKQTRLIFPKIISFLQAKKIAIGTTSRLGYPATENKQLKKLNDFVFNISDKVTFVQELKLLFPNEKGKTLKAIINILKVQNILIIGDREFKAFYDALKIEFNRDIGTYTSINDVKEIHEQITTPIESKVKLLINKHKTY